MTKIERRPQRQRILTPDETQAEIAKLDNQPAPPLEEIGGNEVGLTIDEMVCLIIGDAPLVTNRFSEKMRKRMLDGQTGETLGKKDKKVPKENFMGARHISPQGWDGIPAPGLKAALVGGARAMDKLTMAGLKGSIRVVADDKATNLVRIYSKPPIMREDTVRNSSGVADIRHRPEYTVWAILLHVRWLASAMTLKQLMQLIYFAGFSNGIGEWRPSAPKSLSGTWGTWRLATDEEMTAFKAGKLHVDGVHIPSK